MNWLEFLGASALRGTIILAAAFAAAAALRRCSAAVRHFLWSATFAVLLLLPPATLVSPKWKVPVTATASVAVGPHEGPPAQGWSAASVDLTLLLFLWVLGCGAVTARFLAGFAGTSRMVRRAAEASYAAAAVEGWRGDLGIRRPVRALESSDAPLPLTWGLRRPVALLPADSREWPPARLNAVLLHELVHIQRLDLLPQLIAQAACCLYWFHPLAWLAARQLRKERERACDDAVLRRGIAPPEYAGHLVDLVRALSTKQSGWTGAPAMAESCDFESRVRALLDRGRNRRPLTRRVALSVAAAACAVLLPLAAITARAQSGRGALAGVVKDASGGRVPQCEVAVRNLGGSNQEVTRTNDAGEYLFAAIPAGHYAVEFRARGFAMGKADVVLVAGAAARVDGNLEIGAVSETMMVRGQKPPAAAPAMASRTPQRILIGGNVQATRLIHQTRPEYPAELQQLGIQGTVVLRAVISKTGEVLNPQVISTEVHPGLAKAALDAVRQWRYQPTLLNGQPVEVATSIRVDFQLEQ